MRWLRKAVWIATAVYWVGIFIATHLPPEKLGKVPRVPDKVAHFLIFFGLAAVLGTAMLLTFPARRMVPVWVLVISLAYGAVDEILQPLVRRQASVRDWVADGLGIVPAVVLLAIVQHVMLNRARTASHRNGSEPLCNSSSLPTTSRP